MPRDVEEIAAEQYLYWRARGWTHGEMLAAISRPDFAGDFAGDDVVQQIMAAWQSLYRRQEEHLTS